jgi:hypothetical protein
LPTSALTIKPANHRVLPVTQEKKIELLKLLVVENDKLSIFIFTNTMKSELSQEITQANVTILQDDELQDGMQADYVISLEIPEVSQTYFKRVACAKQKASLLLNKKEQNALYQIETLLQRVLKQEIIEGFGYPEKPKPAPKQDEAPRKSFEKKSYDKKSSWDKSDKPKRDFKSSDEKKPWDKSDKPKRDFKSSDEKKPWDKSDKPKRDFKSSDEKKSWDKSDKPKFDGKKKEFSKKKDNKFLGKDENGKALFSGKSGERNHRYDGSTAPREESVKKTGKSINIKALKEKPKEK